MSKKVPLVFVVGPLGFEPRIARAPGVYPNPDSYAYSQDTMLRGKVRELSMLDDGPALNDYTDQVKKCLDSLA
jgi:hypothetical protein